MSERPDIEAAVERLREYQGWINDGFRDEDGVWHRGPHRRDYNAALDSLAAIAREERERAERAEDEVIDKGTSLLHHIRRAEQAEALCERYRRFLTIIADGEFATPHPDGAFGLPPNTWRTDEVARKVARAALAKLREEEKSDTKESR